MNATDEEMLKSARVKGKTLALMAAESDGFLTTCQAE